jgi:hypothetical protein
MCTTTVLLLSGMDQSIHMYCEVGLCVESVQQIFQFRFLQFGVLFCRMARIINS